MDDQDALQAAVSAAAAAVAGTGLALPGPGGLTLALYYVAHRLFAAHDRALGAYFAERLARAAGPDSVRSAGRHRQHRLPDLLAAFRGPCDRLPRSSP